MFGFTDLEDRLLGPDAAATLQRTLDTLREIAGQVQASIAAGLPHDDYAQARKILAATAAAEHILLSKANRREFEQ